MPIPEQDVKKLWGLAAGRCSKPGCEVECIKFFGADPTIIGEMAHIIARQPQGRRGVPGGGANSYDNLLLLCPTHHTEIDKAPDGAFPPELLHEWKDTHERRVQHALSTRRYVNRFDLFRDVLFLLIDNHQIWKAYGPESDEARRNPISNAVDIWNLRKISNIIPNNTRICFAIDGSRELLTPDEYTTASLFKEHAAAFAAHCFRRTEGYPTFPQSFREMVERNG